MAIEIDVISPLRLEVLDLRRKRVNDLMAAARFHDCLNHLVTVINNETDEGNGKEWTDALRCAMIRALRALAGEKI